MIDSPLIPLLSLGLAAVVLKVFSEHALAWLNNNPGKVLAFLAGVAGLFVFIRFAPGLFAALRSWLCSCGG